MRSDDIDELQSLVNAASDWRTAAVAIGVNINVIVTQINGSDVTLSWNPDIELWDIRTQ